LSPDSAQDRLDFGEALKALRSGGKVTRLGWNANDQWIAISPGFTLGPDEIFSEPVRRHVAATGQPGLFRPYLMLHTAQGDFVPWAPTVSDVLAEDWSPKA
jgi:hypothetical protein